MSTTDARCNVETRRHDIREKHLNGLDFVEVGDEQLELTVFFLGKAPDGLTKDHVRIDGGPEAVQVEVQEVRLCTPEDTDLDDCLKVSVDRPGDFSRYTLRVVEIDERNQPTGPFHGFDPRYASVEFSFKAGCSSDLDCRPAAACPEPVFDTPEIGYLAKDYASFRQLILDRLALTLPGWRERHVPDLGIALVELLAYVGDHLSYYQDAVGTEAYLGTARRRISVRRHARLVDYHMHEGSNARAWVVVDTTDDIADLETDRMRFLTRLPGEARASRGVVPEEALRTVPPGQYEVFEPVERGGKIGFFEAHNTIHFYTWGDRQCCLPVGATSATLRDRWEGFEEPTPGSADYAQQDKPPERPPKGRRPRDKRAQAREGAADVQQQYKGQQQYEEESSGQTPRQDAVPLRALRGLRAGDVLVFEEIRGALTGTEADADRTHRHVVRLTKVEPDLDRLYEPWHEDPYADPARPRQSQDERLKGRGIPIVRIEWHQDDALPFPLCLSALVPVDEKPDPRRPGEGETVRMCRVRPVSVARGNVVLVDHGLRISAEPVGTAGQGSTLEACCEEGHPPERARTPAPFGAVLKEGPLTFALPHEPGAPAARLVAADVNPRLAKPFVSLKATPPASGGEQGAAVEWTPVPDLLASGPRDTHFVVEMDDEGLAHLRFGDGELGHRPSAGSAFQATYRAGNGPSGNVGAEAIAHLVLSGTSVIVTELKPRNPLPAMGGTMPEPIDETRTLAPGAARAHLVRAVTPGDYGALAERHPGVQRAAAALEWTGSGYQVTVALDERSRAQASRELCERVARDLDRDRRIGHTVVVMPARHVPLDIELRVCVEPTYVQGHVKEALLEAFGNRVRPDGRLGYFHPDNLTFGQQVYLSALVAHAQAIEGVESVEVTRFQRRFEDENGEIESGVLRLRTFEIARVDNDPAFPEHGRIDFVLGGGR